jgi:hypothetical protein
LLLVLTAAVLPVRGMKQRGKGSCGKGQVEKLRRRLTGER